MNFASPWKGKDAPIDDGQWMKHRRALQDLVEISEPTWGETVVDVAATAMAVAQLGAEKGLWSEKEFISAKMRCVNFLDQERKRMQDQVLFREIRALRMQLHVIREAVLQWCLQAWKDLPGYYTVEVMRVQQGSQPISRSKPGKVLVRISSPHFTGMENRTDAIHGYVKSYTESLPNFFESQLQIIAITTEEWGRSPQSLEFDNYVRDLEMEEENGVYQRRIAGLEGEGPENGGNPRPERPLDGGLSGPRV